MFGIFLLFYHNSINKGATFISFYKFFKNCNGVYLFQGVRLMAGFNVF